MTDIVWSNFHFLRPHVLWLLIPAIWLLYRWHRQSHGHDGWQQQCDPDLLAAMQVETGTTASRWRYLFWPVVMVAILALAGPAVRQKDVPVVKSEAALIIALDVSRSMLSDDLKPNRLTRAKFKIRDLLASREDGLTALIAFSGDAFVVTPLTDDTETIVNLLDVVEPGIMPTTGTNTVAALEKSQALLNQSGLSQGQILLITDDIKLYKSEDKLAALAAQNIKTHILAVGTTEGAPIKTNRGFVKDLRGQVVIPKVNFNHLKQAAAAGNGRFSVLSNQRNDMNLYDPADNSRVNNEGESTAGHNQFVDDGIWLLLMIVPLTLLLYRRGLLMVLALGLFIQPQISHAFKWQDLWLNKDQQAYNQLQENPEVAQQLAQNPRLKGTAAYRAQAYQQAIEQLQALQQVNADDHYNLGNALAQAGDLEAALEQYKQALEIAPDDKDTLYNKKIVEQALKQQNKQSSDQSDSNQNQKQNGEQQNNPESEQQTGDGQEQNNQDSEDQQGQDSQSKQQKDQESEQQKQQAQKDASKESDQQERAEESSQQQATEEQSKEQQQLSPEEQQQQAEEAQRLAQEEALNAEEQQAIEQWLRRIQDDPGGLMRRKFLYQYHRQNPDGEPYDNQTTEDW